MKNRKTIFLPANWRNDLMRTISEGIFAFAHDRHLWSFVHIDQTPSAIRAIATRQPDGLIGRFGGEETIAAVQELNVPFVNVTASLNRPGMAQVGEDNREEGRMAAEHFMDRGFKNFGCLGLESETDQASRFCWNAFQQTLSSGGHLAHRLDIMPGQGWTERIRAWLEKLPKPVAVLCRTDSYALVVYGCCQELGLDVPADVAILGIGDDHRFCFSAVPRLSSIQLPAFQMGYEAAQLLDNLMQGGKLPKPPILFSPTGIAERRSTDYLQFEDPHLKKAVHFIHDHLSEKFSIQDMVRHSGICRRALEKRFRAGLGHSPQIEIRRMRVEKAKEFLRDTTLPLQEIAERCGLNTAAYLYQAFKAVTDTSPAVYRKQFRSKNPQVFFR